MISGWPLAAVLTLLSLWLLFLASILRSALRRTASARRQRTYITVGGLSMLIIAVGALLALHLSWTSPSLSQKLGITGVRIFGSMILWPTIAGLLLSSYGLGWFRIVGVITALVVGVWYFVLSTSAAISMGAVTARHPTRYLVPAGYVGWITIKYGESAPALEIENGEYICRVPKSGVLATSSVLEEGWGKDEYFYYSETGTLESLPESNWGGGGKVWGESVERQVTSNEFQRNRVSERIYIGTEDQYHRNEIHPAHSF